LHNKLGLTSTKEILMNKNLIALAVAGAFVAPAALAQTANPVTLYGQVNMTVESVEARGGTAAVVSRRTRIEDQSSRLGVRGTEDLGGGLKAFFQLETGFRPDSNNTTFAARNSAVGLQGGWGSILIGRWDMPFKSATTAIDPWGDITIAGITGVLNDGTNFDRRDMNVGEYWSPTFGGFAFRLAGTANERKNDPAGVNARDLGASVTFTRGPIYLFGAYEEHKDNNNGNAFGQIIVAPPATGQTAGIAGYEEKGMAGGGSFVIGPVKLGAQYQEYKKTSRSKQKAFMGNVVFTAGNNQFIYQYMQSKDGRLSTAVTEEPDCDSNSIGYKYNFSRRTSFIAHYVDVKNNSTASCNFGSNRLAAAAGQDPRGFAVGFLHVF
jgi:predicted porin